jgi:hypothetical protein
VDLQKLVVEEDKSPCLEPVQRAARKLERMGCRAIAAECGYFACFQQEIAGHVNVPVFLSSLLQVPWAQRLIGPDKVVGILVASQAFLMDAHLEAVGVEIGSNYVVAGAMDGGCCPEFENLWVSDVRPDPPQAAYETAQRDLIAVGYDFFQSHANMGAMVLECTGFPPFARALQREIDIPIFSWGTLLDLAYSVVVHRDYYGHV